MNVCTYCMLYIMQNQLTSKEKLHLFQITFIMHLEILKSRNYRFNFRYFNQTNFHLFQVFFLFPFNLINKDYKWCKISAAVYTHSLSLKGKIFTI